jgi:hypothetical protein
MAESRLAAAPVFIYALVFVFVEIAYIAFERTAFSQSRDVELTAKLKRAARARCFLALSMFSTAAAISFWSPQSGLVLVCCVLLIYLNPRMPDWLQRSAH